MTLPTFNTSKSITEPSRGSTDDLRKLLESLYSIRVPCSEVDPFAQKFIDLYSEIDRLHKLVDCDNCGKETLGIGYANCGHCGEYF